MRNKYRVAHVGTGYTGAIALRQVLRSPRLELVGHLVHSREKAGRDAGELAGESPVGVAAIADADDFLAIDADCVTYFAAISGRDSDEIVEELCGFLASGKNVVTPSYPALFHPPSLDDGRASSLKPRAARATARCSPRASHRVSRATCLPCTRRP